MCIFFYLSQSFNVNLIFNLVNIYCVSRGNSPGPLCVRIYHSSDLLRSETRASSEPVIIGWYAHVGVCECGTRVRGIAGRLGEWVSEGMRERGEKEGGLGCRVPGASTLSCVPSFRPMTHARFFVPQWLYASCHPSFTSSYI